jgi:DNA-binding transcriptional MerR regulator
MLEVAAMPERMKTEMDRSTPRVDRSMTIGEFSRRSRLSPKALRLYDRTGLLVPDDVDPANRYRRYRESQLDDARLIADLRRLQVPLARVAEIMAVPRAEGAALLAAYWNDVQADMQARYTLATYLQGKMLGKKGSLEMYDVKVREVPEQLVITEQRHVTAGELSTWFPESFSRLAAIASRHGGMKGAPLSIYHGVVNEDSDGPVETAVPIDPGQAPQVKELKRIEPAHREAYVTLRKSQVVFPQILGAYEAVDQWIRENGKAIAGAPREVNFGDFATAGPNDEVVDVAIPIE